METTLEKLWNGKLAPWAQKERRSKEIAELAACLQRQYQTLLARLDDEGKATLEKLKEHFERLENICTEDAFEKGFSLATRLLTQALSDNAWREV